MEVACITVPRLALRAACEGDWELPADALALAPLPGGSQVVGEVSVAAERNGVRAGMALGEALARCPGLRLVTPDPGGAEDLWEGAIRRLEGIGAAVESERPGEAFFAVDGLKGIHGGDTAGVMMAARRAVGVPARIAVAPTRFAAFVAVNDGRLLARISAGGRPSIVSLPALREFLAPLSVATLQSRLLAPGREAYGMIVTLKRLGVGTLAELATLSSGEVADRFGSLGLQALRLARGEDAPPRPRDAHVELSEEIELPEGTSGSQLDHALELLVDRLLAGPERRGRTLLALRLGARLSGGGSWSVPQGLGQPTASAEILCAVLTPRLAALPGPATSLRLQAVSLGPLVGDQLVLSTRGDERRRRRLAEAVREVRAVEGAEALLKVLVVDTVSHIPERRAMLTPFPDA